MSLLQEALKRKEQDQPPGNPETATAPDAPANAPAENKNGLSVPQGMAPAEPQDSPPQSIPVLNQQAEETQSFRRKTSVLWVIVAVIAIFVSVTVAAGFAYFFYRFLPASKAKVTRIVRPIAPPAVPHPATAPAVSVQPPQEPPAAKAGEAGTQSAAADMKKAPAPADTIAQTGAPSGQISVRQQTAAGAGQKPVPAKPSALKTGGPVAPPAVKWPLLKLSGILCGSGKNENSALINGKLISTGQAMENVTLVEIQSDGVILEYGGEKRFLRVGAVSY